MDTGSAIAMMGIAVLVHLIMFAVPADAKPTAVTIDLHDEKQVIHSFGASDAWTCQFVGENWPVEKRKAIADLLFSSEVDSRGNPKGIALSMWRFNVGAGSAQQGDSSRIRSPWHRAECFQNPDGSYNWDRQKGQQWFLEAARERGVPYLLAFTVSPPVHLTLNGIAHSDAGRTTLNLRKDAMPDFADFLADVAEYFHRKGTPFQYISPVNEPQWGWESDKQEGSPATNAEIYELTRLIAGKLHEKGVPSKVMIAEAGSLESLTGKNQEDPRGNQIHAFWSPESPYYLGRLNHNLAHVISGHSYFTTWPLSRQVLVREQLRDCIARTNPKLSFWQTEFSILEKNDEIGQGWGRDLGMDTALYVARVIHNDLTIANASHWSWWLAISHADYKDGLVCIEADKDDKSDEPVRYDGRVLPSKIMWALGNFSRFVRPGMVRVGVSYTDKRSLQDMSESLMVSAYLDKKTRQLVIVLVNVTQEPQVFSISNQGNGLKTKGNTFSTYTTSENSSLSKGQTSSDKVLVSPKSVVTLVGKVL